MKEIIENYGGAILTFIVIVALIGILVWLVAGDNSPVAGVFKDLIDNFFDASSSSTTSVVQPTT